METRQIVTELYTLRAGLSLIAKEKDKFDAEIKTAAAQRDKTVTQARAMADNTIQEINDGVSRVKQSSQHIQTMLDMAKNRTRSAQEAYEENEKILNDTKYSEEFLKKHKRNETIRLLFGILFILLHIATAIMIPFITYLHYPRLLFIPILSVALVIGITEFCMAAKEYDLDEIWYGAPYIVNVLSIGLLMTMVFCNVAPWNFFHIIFFGLTMISAVTCVIFTSIRTYAYIKDSMIDYYKRNLAKRAQAISKQSELKAAVENAEREYQKMKKSYDENNSAFNFEDIEADRENHIRTAENKYNATRERAEKQYLKTYNASADVHGKICSGIWDTLVRTYGDLLDVRDWGILDLVVWQLETGRAETLKEALQLADRETQTDRIVQTMQSASAAIAQRIDAGFENLQTQLSNSFYALATGLAKATSIISGQISRSSDLLIGKIDENAQATALMYENQNNTMLTTNKNIEQLFSQASLQTALLEKSNSSSKDLIEAVNKLRKAQNA